MLETLTPTVLYISAIRKALQGSKRTFTENVAIKKLFKD